MSRRTRNWLNRSCYHITHRCLNREFFFENFITRQTYLKELREMLSRFHVDLLNYIITCNHVHLLVYAGNGEEIAKGMQYLQGRMAQRYNMLTGREGAFWSGRYHATLIESGNHLSQCLFYIDYNMTRAGVVEHPSEWLHAGYHELSGNKKRNRIINFNKLLKHIGMSTDKERFLKWYNLTIDSKAKSNMERQRYWTESLAVGSEEWIDKIKRKIGKTRIIVIDTKHFKEHKDIVYPEMSQSVPEVACEQHVSYALY
jgi:REP-associated tyrosine transposase